MTTPKILLHSNNPDPLRKRLAQAVPEAEVEICATYEGVAGILASFKPDIAYSVRFGGTYGFPTEDILGPNGPKWIAVGGAGCDHLGCWDEARVTVTNSAGVAGAMMAEYAFGCFLHFTLDIGGLTADKQTRHWQWGRTVRPLKGKTILIVGLGGTGRAVAARAKAFGMYVIGIRARPEPMDHVDEVHASTDLSSLWGRADAIVISVPLLPSTAGLVDHTAFGAMKDGVLLADVSRGGVVVQDALVEAVTSGKIGGAGLDVFELEPLPEDSPVWGLDRVIISPHCSSVHADWEMDSFELFLDNLQNWMAGRPLFNIVDPARGY